MKRIPSLLLLLALSMSSLTQCQSEKQIGANPFFEEWTAPYGVPPLDRIEAAHFMPAFERAMAEEDAEIDAIVTNHDEPTFENVCVAFDNAGQKLDQATLIFGMLCEAESSEELQAVQEEAIPALAAHDAAIRMNEELFQKIKTIYDKRKAMKLTAVQCRLVEKQYKAFVREGALLSTEDKARLKVINQELNTAEMKFGQNLLAENNDYKLVLDDSNDITGIPTDVRMAAERKAREVGEDGKWVFTLHKPSLVPFMTYSTRRDLRQELYTAYLNRGANDNEHNNKQLINDMIRLRTEKAHLLGFKCYADYVTNDQMAGSSKAVYDLLNEVYTPALERAKKELEEMMPLFRRDVKEGNFESWDWMYYAEKLRKQKYALDEEMLRPYFSLENARSGIFFLANRLYGITFRPVTVPTYHQEVSAYQVLDVDESHLGILLFDFYQRDGKSQGAWCGNYVDQTYRDGERVAPVVSIVTNFTRPAPGGDSLLTMDEVETLFHEFGHALHFLFHDVKYRGLSEVEGDFVEMPSQMLENWAFEPEVLKHYATHFRTKELIPEYMVKKIHRSTLFNQGFMTTELVAAALSDMAIHSQTKYEEFDPEDFETKILRKRRHLIPEIAPRYRYPYFAHIFAGGYASGYYFYTWAEVLDQDAFEAFRESGDLFNREIAHRLRYKLLARGGEEDGMSLYRAFRLHDPDKKPMLRSRGLWEDPVVEEETDTAKPHRIEGGITKFTPVQVTPGTINRKPEPVYQKIKKDK